MHEALRVLAVADTRRGFTQGDQDFVLADRLWEETTLATVGTVVSSIYVPGKIDRPYHGRSRRCLVAIAVVPSSVAAMAGLAQPIEVGAVICQRRARGRKRGNLLQRALPDVPRHLGGLEEPPARDSPFRLDAKGAKACWDLSALARGDRGDRSSATARQRQ